MLGRGEHRKSITAPPAERYGFGERIPRGDGIASVRGKRIRSASTSWLINPFLLGYAAVYALFLFLLHKVEHFGLSEPLLLLAIVGIGFSALAWWFTRRAVPLPFEVKRPGRETLLLAVYLVALAAFIAWGLSAVASSVPREPWKSVAILAEKLAVFVALPLLLFRASGGYRPGDFLPPRSGWRRHARPALWMALVLILFQCVFGRGLAEIQHSGLPAWALIVGIPLAYLWLLVEVGLVEEFFFRVLLQSRLSAWLRSEVAGIVVMSLLFGLAHAPGFYYRTGQTLEGLGPHPSWLMAVGYSIVVTSVAGFFLGVLWARTRNLVLVMVVHAAGDLVPNLAPMLRNWL